MKRIPEYDLSDVPKSDVPITAQNWQPFWQQELVYDVSAIIWFIDASTRDANEIEKLVSSAQDFESLKKDLLTFVQGRRDLRKDVFSKMDADDSEKWGFPPPR
jgi:hypothetical protein